MGKKRVIVVGAGAAGLIAAGQAAKSGAEVLLLEKMKRAGMKLSITGKGRCNLTNIAEIPEFIEHFGKTGNFLRQAFHQYFSSDLIDFLSELGLETVAERGGRVFPKSGKAPDVVRTVLDWVRKSGVVIRTSSKVDKLITKDGAVTGVVSSGKKYEGDAVIITTGGKSYPRTGSTGDGYRLAQDAGHRIVDVRPALVPLVCDGDEAGRMEGLNLRNINARILVNGKKVKEAFGELLFAPYGVTGPVILTLSAKVVDHLIAGEAVTLSLDLKPALSKEKLEARLKRDLASRGGEDMKSILRGLLAKEMVPVCLSLIDVPGSRKGASISADERTRLLNWLKDFRMKVTAHRPIDEAITTAGGVDTKEIDPNTMESKVVRGLYVAGELLDVQADTGGYNLQAAFSTGWLAGNSASQEAQ